MTAIMDQMVNSVPRPKRTTAVRFVDATKGCLEALAGISGDYQGFLADPQNLEEVKAKLEESLSGDLPEETLVMIDGWFDADICGGKESRFSDPAMAIFKFVSELGFHAIIFRGLTDESDSCGLAAREVVKGYMN